MSTLSITWLGHATFLLTLPSGKRVVLDPWLSNPNCPPAFTKPEALKPVDVILVTHGHGDHLADVAPLARATGAAVVCAFEMGQYLTTKGLTNVRDMLMGGTQEIDGLKITMTYALHSGSFVEDDRIIYLGGAAGFMLRQPGMPTIYIAGDTGLFGDLKMYGELYKPEIGFLPIGDHYTMGPDTAAIAAKWLGVKQVVPMHYGTFPVLTGTPSMLKQELAGTGIDVLELQPGVTAS
jgi:L-ascorbate metabolism protein UlaG (beta-lactamase superfamily)